MSIMCGEIIFHHTLIYIYIFFFFVIEKCNNLKVVNTLNLLLPKIEKSTSNNNNNNNKKSVQRMIELKSTRV